MARGSLCSARSLSGGSELISAKKKSIIIIIIIIIVVIISSYKFRNVHGNVIHYIMFCIKTNNFK
jgi:hypothetical protein